MVTTYAGFAIGAVNVLFLYTNFLTEEYFGLVMFILASAVILQPILSFGVQDTIIKFYSSYKTQGEKRDFLAMMLILPLLVIIPVAIVINVWEKEVIEILTKKNELIRSYAWLIFMIGIAMAYFEVFYSWCKVHLKSIFGNFMKEVFMRAVVFALLFAVYLDILSVGMFMNALGLMYMVRMFIMMWYAYYLQLPGLRFGIPDNLNEVLKYCGFIVVAGSVVVMLLEVDKSMIGMLLPGLDNVAFYGVAVFIAMIISVPARAMNQIASVLTATFINENRMKELKKLYQKSSLNLFVVGGLLFLLIILNINELYKMLGPDYSKGLVVVILISIAKLMDNLMANNNAILYNSSYYRVVLGLGVLLALLTIIFNMILIPMFGIEGAAMATLISLTIYNGIKLYVVWHVFKMHPFQNNMFITLSILLAFSGAFYYWDFPFHPLMNIMLKSILIALGYLSLTYSFRLSDDLNVLMDKLIKKLPWV